MARPVLVRMGMAAATATSVLALLAAPQASAATGGAVGYTGWLTTLSGVTHQQFATGCGDVFKGPVTSEDGNGDAVASITSFSMSCDQDVSVTPNALPWTLTASGNQTPGSTFTIHDMDVNITTPLGTCRYTGSVNGTAMDQGYDMTGSLSRQSGGCGGDAQVQVDDPFEVFGIG